MTTPPGASRSPHGWRMGSLGGTPVYLGRSWPIIAVVIVVLFGPRLGDVGRGPAYGYLVALGYAVLLLVSVLVHEAAHALAARWSGHPVDRIVADVWGGHTVYDATRSHPGATAVIAVVGPLANLALAALGYVLLPLVRGDTAQLLVGVVTWANLLVGLFNLLPGLPLDGGQIVSALVWKVTGRKGTGLVAAGWLGRVLAVGGVAYLVGVPLAQGRQPDLTTLLWAALIAFFLWKGASDAIRSGHIHEATAGPVDPVLDPAVLVPTSSTVAQAVATASAGGRPVVIIGTDSAGWPVGVVPGSALADIPESRRGTTSLSAALQPEQRDWVVALPPEAVLTDLVRAMGERSLSIAVVIDEPTRGVRGVARAERVNEVVGAELARRGHR
ncbi:MAG: site-2 protease family protein [Intrasporangium sp.]|uniref:site-2 protease family protein n=1 Tax=Intrasporangium sp. TaxID=1925024 RepID=UPI0026495E54|nr:site-2 protease family protein [Intrasporangium sp.]MDN5794670.1 site-2 protease family protein [Intrasporangium sp.]